MAFEKLSPIHSTSEDDVALADAIDAFVIGLGTWIDELQDAQAAGDFAAVRQAAESHADEAVRLGYPVLAEGALEVASAAQGEESEGVRKSINGLVEIVQRIRLGHRTAA